jgi:hypothetical protein
MMLSKKLILLVIAWGLILPGCGPAGVTPAPRSGVSTPGPAASGSPAAGFTEAGFNLLVESQGQVLLKRSAWSDYHPTGFGTVLGRGDLLKLAEGAQARVLCDGLTLWPVPAGAPIGVNNGCPQPPEPPLQRGGARIGSTRAPDTQAPYIISPRATKLLTHTPTLKWNATGAASYTVQVRGGDLEWQQPGVTQTELVYPGEPALQPSVSYLLVVDDSDGRSSQDEGVAGLGFSLLGEAEAGEIQGYAGRIAGLGLSQEGEALAQAQLYAGHGLYAEAIPLLENLVAQDNRQASIHQALADLYAGIGLADLAEARYLAAVPLAEAEGNAEASAAVRASLGKLYADANQQEEALRWLNQALAGYQELGDAQRVSELEAQIAKLSQG